MCRPPASRRKKRNSFTNTPSSKKHPESDLSMLIRSIRVIRRSISSSVPLLTSAMLQRRSRPTAGPNSHIRQRRSVYILLMCFANAIIFSTMFSGHEHRGITARLREVTEERFYNYLSFYSFADLQEQMKRYLRRSNNIPMAVLGWKSPAQKHRELESRHA